MNIIITMAGESSRFKSAGFKDPKFMLTANGHTLFYWSMLSLKNLFESKFIFVTLEEHSAESFIRQECDKLGIANYAIKPISEVTSGQAETALMAKPLLNSNEPFGIYNIDTYLQEPLTVPRTIEGQGWIPVFEADGDKWSFVCFDRNGKALEIAEKKRISSFATVGFYYFKSFDIFLRCLERYGFEDYKEKFVAPLYSLIIDSPGSKGVYVEVLDPDSVVALGTPEDVKLFDPHFGSK